MSTRPTWGGEEPGHPGRPEPDSQKKVAVALELNDEGKPRRVAMASVKRVTGHPLKRFAVKVIAKGSTLRTDGWAAYRVVAAMDSKAITYKGLIAGAT